MLLSSYWDLKINLHSNGFPSEVTKVVWYFGIASFILCNFHTYYSAASEANMMEGIMSVIGFNENY